MLKANGKREILACEQAVLFGRANFKIPPKWRACSQATLSNKPLLSGEESEYPLLSFKSPSPYYYSLINDKSIAAVVIQLHSVNVA